MEFRSVRVVRHIIHGHDHVRKCTHESARQLRDRRHRGRSPQAKIHYFTFAIFTILPFACESFGSFTTVTYKSFSPSPNATFVVPSPAAISNTCRSLPSGDIFKILPPNHWAT